jgi:hypothetical protein
MRFLLTIPVTWQGTMKLAGTVLAAAASVVGFYFAFGLAPAVSLAVLLLFLARCLLAATRE